MICIVAAVSRRWILGIAAAVLAAVVAATALIATGQVLLPVHTPGSKSVPLTVITRHGPVAGSRVDILAAPSMPDLNALVVASSPPTLCPGNTCWPQVVVGQPSLFIALPAPALCRKTALNADVGPGKVLTIHLVVGAWECPPGAGARPAPYFWLLSVPISALPKDVITVRLDSSTRIVGFGVGGEPLDLPTGQTIVDLR
jgi:hypothetical protein